jgi:hypothetical protein
MKFVLIYAQLNDGFEIDYEFPLCWACTKIGYSLAEHARKLQRFGTVTIFIGSGSGCDFWQVTVPVPHIKKLQFLWLRLRFRFHNTGKLVTHWLNFPKIGYSLAKHTQKQFPRTTCIFRVFPLSPVTHFSVPFSRPYSLYLCFPSYVLRLCSLSSVLCTLSHVSVPCLPSAVPCLTSLVSRPLSLSHVSVSGLPSSVPCLTWSVPCLLSSFLHPLSPINCPSVPFL